MLALVKVDGSLVDAERGMPTEVDRGLLEVDVERIEGLLLEVFFLRTAVKVTDIFYENN